MRRSVRVAVVQLLAHDRADFARLSEHIVDAAADAANGAELVVLPEGTLPAYVLGDATHADAALVTETLERLRNLARQTSTVIVAGAAMKQGNSLRNAAVPIDRNGSLAGSADKLFLWHFDRRWFEGGSRLSPIDTAVGRLGVLVCADGRLPTIARALVDRGAEMLVMPTAWVTTGRNPDALENVQADLLGRVRAYENNVPFVAANKCGAELGMVAYCGKSQIVGDDGEIVAIAGERKFETLAAPISVGEAIPKRSIVSDVAPRATTVDLPLRVAISPDRLPRDVDQRLEILDDAFAIAPYASDRLAAINKVLPTVSVNDETILDPGGLVGYRRAGYRLAVWTTAETSPWTERIARARALELRIYVVVFDRTNDRAYAVDPDGLVVAGTFDRYRLASFALDPRKTTETTVAPGTDVVEGLERVAAIARHEGLATK
ncbi:MAG TPA: carbon-nitrogen hydrolase family protein [Candidatus Baltobacteraceae bacterium]|jgi:predicted amidohydrolase|nr:carbon-nitrogen hydrolase family protein [Candidatus Baltobacteraceae bacterium]